MAGSSEGRFLRRGMATAGLAAAVFLISAAQVDARPVRGPVMRVERRMARIQALLERELARPPARPAVQAPAQAVTPATSPAAPTPVSSGVAQAAFETPAPAAAADPAAATREPAPDGTYSVLVRPEGEAESPAKGRPAQAGEPLRFPESSTP